MGGYYTNITLNITDREAVAELLRNASRDAFVSPVENGGLVVFDELNDRTCGVELEELAVRLSTDLECSALAVTHADGSHFTYDLYVRGHRVDRYAASPSEIVGGDAQELCRAFTAPSMASGVEAILRRRYIVQADRHQALVSALGLPVAAVGLGYEYLTHEADELRSTYGEFLRIVRERQTRATQIAAGAPRVLPWAPGDAIPTLAGVGIGQTRDDVVAVLGKPTRSASLGPTLSALWYDERGIEVLLLEEPSNVRGVTVSDRRGPDLKGVHVGDSWTSVKERWGPPSERWTISGDDDVAYLYHVGPYWTLNVHLDPGEDRVLTLGLSPSLIGRQEKHATIPSGER